MAEYLSNLGSRDAAAGCGRDYYDCPSVPDTGHQLLTCNKWVWEKPTGYLNAFKSYRCGVSFRPCTWWLTRDHNPTDLIPIEVEHSTSGDTDNSTPAMAACSIHAEGTSGYHVSYVCNDAPCNNRVYWGCVYAQCPETSSHGTITGACGHTYASSESNSHSIQASCTSVSVYGVTCSVTSFYACQSHTHTYPTVECSRSACQEQVPFANFHHLSCINNHPYWSCDTGWDGYDRHRRRSACTREIWKTPVWDRVLGRYTSTFEACGKSWAMCEPVCRDEAAIRGPGSLGTHQE